jgi:hypothetical protein
MAYSPDPPQVTMPRTHGGYTYRTLSATGVDDFTGANVGEFAPDIDSVVADIQYFFEAGVEYRITLQNSPTSPEIDLIASTTAGVDGDNGAVGNGRPVTREGVVRVYTGGAVNGDKTVTMLIVPVDGVVA